MTSKKYTYRHKKGSRSNSRSTSGSLEPSKQPNVFEASVDQDMRTRDLGPIDPVKQNRVAKVEGSSIVVGVENTTTNLLTKINEKERIDFLSKANNLSSKSVHYAAGPQYTTPTADIYGHINQLTTQLATSVINASAEISFKNIDAFIEPM
jgi:hypothetical protein